jgi:hypothetical protein
VLPLVRKIQRLLLDGIALNAVGCAHRGAPICRLLRGLVRFGSRDHRLAERRLRRGLDGSSASGCVQARLRGEDVVASARSPIGGRLGGLLCGTHGAQERDAARIHLARLGVQLGDALPRRGDAAADALQFLRRRLCVCVLGWLCGVRTLLARRWCLWCGSGLPYGLRWLGCGACGQALPEVGAPCHALYQAEAEPDAVGHLAILEAVRLQLEDLLVTRGPGYGCAHAVHFL